MKKLWQFIVIFFCWMFKDRDVECSEFLDVKEFHLKFGMIVNDRPTHLTKRKLVERIQCMQEELDEFKAACNEQDLAAQADALVDLVYFAKGTAVMLGLPWAQLWDDVQAANMAKVRGIGPRGHAVDCIKPPGWTPPQTAMILRHAGYDPASFSFRSIYVNEVRDGKWVSHTHYDIDEGRCCDDAM